MSNFKSIVTHNGLFHADEVTACALLIHFASASRAIERTRDASIIEAADVVVDVGGIFNPLMMRFDHHQDFYEGTLSSAGMVLSFLESEMPQGLAQYLRDQFIDGVDAIDNGLAPKLEKGFLDFSGVISSFNTDDPFGNDQDWAFMSAVEFTIEMVERMVTRHEKLMKDAAKIDAAFDNYDGKGILELPGFLNWQKDVCHFNGLADDGAAIRRVIWPQADGWRVQVPPKELGSFELGAAPLTGEDAPEDLVFVHKAGFIGGAKSKEGALQLAS